MDFDYQKIKDPESQQRDKRMNALVHQPVPKPRPPVAPENHLTTKKPPVKPRRSIKCRPAAQQGAEQLNQSQQKENEATVKRIDPALVLGPARLFEPLTPTLRAHTLLWFERTQLPRLHTPGQPLPCWLHGFATRREAEQLLQDKPQGCFLLRLSESKIGFVLSYRGADRCRHFIIEEEESEASASVYLIAGENSRHRSLENLINHYTYNPLEPFNELLTVPCTQPTGGYGEINMCRMMDREGDGKAPDEEEQTKLSMATGPAVLNLLPITPSNQIMSDTDKPVQYAVVRKLKKTYSLPECKCGAETAPPGQVNGSAELAEISTNFSLPGDQDPLVDVPYARVNKPHRTVPQNPPDFSAHTDLQGATAAITPPSIPNFDATAGDPKYWKLEPMHTYEETPHTRTRPEEIDCYAVGWRRQASGDIVNLPKNHLYSEVNIKGAQEGHSMQTPGPSLPLRPPPRSSHGLLRPEIPGQSFGVSPLMAQHQYSGFHHTGPDASSSSIYEQIPERSRSSRPALLPPNPKR